jgi:hypothetical protein
MKWAQQRSGESGGHLKPPPQEAVDEVRQPFWGFARFADRGRIVFERNVSPVPKDKKTSRARELFSFGRAPEGPSDPGFQCVRVFGKVCDGCDDSGNGLMPRVDNQR